MIPKRVFWFSAGSVMGVAGAAVGYGRLRRLKGRDVADRVADGLASGLERATSGAWSAMVETRRSIAEAEVELRERYGLDEAQMPGGPAASTVPVDGPVRPARPTRRGGTRGRRRAADR
jgi:hypothetical protein